MTRTLSIPRWAVAGLMGTLIVVEGVAAARVGYVSFQMRQAVLVLVTGWAVAGSGLVGWVRVPTSRTGLLLVTCGSTWYLGSFAGSQGLGLVYAAVMVQAILSYPSGRIRERSALVMVVAALAWAAALVPGTNEGLLATALVVGLVLAMTAPRPRRDPRRGPSIVLGGLFTIALLFRGGLPLGDTIDSELILEVVVVMTAMGLTWSLVRDSARRATVTDLVVELGSSSGGDLARELADAVDDPTLKVGYWLPEQGRYVDATGNTFLVAESNDRLETTVIERDGRPVAVLVHDPAIGADAALRSAVAHAAELAATNARLQADVQEQVEQVQASRRRLVRAGDEERQDLQRRLRAGLGPRLAALQTGLAATDLHPPGEDPLLDDALAQIDAIRTELVDLAEGLRPRLLEERGVAGALADLCARSAVPVDLWVGEGRDEPAATDATIYFVCSEALTNVGKHASASRASVRLDRSDGSVRLDITDDGVGGVDLERGTGLRGLRDRVEALGGRLTIDSRPGHGTRLVAAIPPWRDVTAPG